MIERGRARTEAAGFDVEWVQADAEDLPFEDGRFDCAGSVFGAFLAPRPEVAARELFRVVRELNERDGLTVLVVEQNARSALDVAHRATVLEVGRVAVEGSADELRADESIRRSYLGY